MFGIQVLRSTILSVNFQQWRINLVIRWSGASWAQKVIVDDIYRDAFWLCLPVLRSLQGEEYYSYDPAKYIAWTYFQ